MRSAYPFERSPYGNKFEFTSEGIKGKIRKGVVFDMEDDNLYNLTMGDLDEKGYIKELTLTGNSDPIKVFATVANIIEYFLFIKPKARVFITGTTEKHDNVYKKLILREIQLGTELIIEGFNEEGILEPVNPDKYYDAFLVKRQNNGRFTQ